MLIPLILIQMNADPQPCFETGLPELPIFEISGSSSRQIPAPAPAPTPTISQVRGRKQTKALNVG